MNSSQELDKTVLSIKHDTNEIQISKTEASNFKSFGLLPAKSSSRIQKIKNAVIDINDENICPTDRTLPTTSQDFDPECRKLRDSYSLHKKQRNSKSRTRSTNAKEIAKEKDDYLMFQNDTALIPVNRYKRSNEGQEKNYQSKYQKLEENFKKFTRNLQDKRQSKSPVETKRRQPAEKSTDRQYAVARHQVDHQVHHPVSVLGFVYLKPESQPTSSIVSKPISDRQLALRNVLKQTQHFLCTTLFQLHQLSVSKAQELELQELQIRISESLSTEDERVNLEQLFVSFTTQIQEILGKILHRVYQVESTTFLNYKFKDVLSLFETLLQESYRLQVNDLMPALVHSIKMHRAQAACFLISAISRTNIKKRQATKFNTWRTMVRRIQLLKRINSSIKRNQYIRSVSSAFQLWANSKSNESSRVGLIETLVTNQQYFTECLESDIGLTNHIVKYFQLEYDVDCDLILLTEDDVTVYDPQLQQVIQMARAAIAGSITDQMIESGEKIKTVKSVISQRNFNDKIDRPFLMNQELKKYKTDFSMVYLILRPTSQQDKCKSVIRVLINENKPRRQLESTLKLVSNQAQSFLNRIFQLRLQIGSLAEELQISQEQVRVSELERTVQKCLFDILHDLHYGTKQEFIKLIQNRTQLLLTELYTPGETILRQIYIKKQCNQTNLERVELHSLINDQNEGQQTLIRKRDHKKEQTDILFDILDYQKDQLIHQTSIDTPKIQIVLHKILPLESKRFITLSQDLKMALRLLAKCLQPVIFQGLKIHEDLADLVSNQSRQLYLQVQADNGRESCRQKLKNLSLCDEKDGFEKVTEALTSFFSNWEKSEFRLLQSALLINESIFNGKQVKSSKLVGYLNDSQQKLVAMPETFKETSNQTQQRQETGQNQFLDLHQELQVKDGQITAKFANRRKQGILSVVCLSFETESRQVNELKHMVQAFQAELGRILEEEIDQASQQEQFRESFSQLKEKISSLQVDIDFIQAVQETLILPFTRSPSLKVLGHALYLLTKRAIPIVAVDSIALEVGGQIVNSDIRMMQFEFGPKITSPLTNTVTVHQDSITILLPANGRSILVKVLYSRVDQEEEGESELVFQNCEVYQQIISPFVANALDSLTNSLLPVVQENLPRVLVKIVKQRQFLHATTLLMALYELRVKRVPIFTRLDSYSNIIKLRPLKTQGYLESSKLESATRAHAFKVYLETFQSLNRIANKKKKALFYEFKLRVLELMHREQEILKYQAAFQPTKKQRKCLNMLKKVAQRVSMRAYFSRFAVKAKVYRRLNNPHNKAFAAALCLQHNYIQMRLRLAFQRMRVNASDRCFRDYTGVGVKDRDFMAELQRQLLSQIPLINGIDSSHQLESQITEVLEQAITYLQETLLPESLDTIVFSLKQVVDGKRARAYLFNRGQATVKSDASVLHMDSTEAFDIVTSQNVNLLVESSNENVEQLADFNLSLEKDIILQMLQKSQTMFNFSNIGNSLYDLYLSQFGKSNYDKDIMTRMILLKKSKSALLCPLTVMIGDEARLIGSLELYRHYGQQFDTENEQRLKVFTSHLSGVCHLFLGMRASQMQILEAKQQLALNSRPTTDLTSLLRSLQAKAPHLLNAQHFLCLILDSQGFAHFYQFKDSYIYNFNYQGTLIDEVIELECVLELSNNSVQENNTQESETWNDGFQISMIDSGRNKDHHMRSVKGLLKTITNVEGFRKIFYYPIMVGGQVKAVFEVGYQNENQAPQQALNDQVTTLTDLFSMQLSHVQSKLSTFCKVNQLIFDKKRMVAIAIAFKQWKSWKELLVQKETFEQEISQTNKKQDQCYEEYVKCLESYDLELKKLTVEKSDNTQEIVQLRKDNKCRLKQISSSMMILRTLDKQKISCQKLNALQTWKANVLAAKIAETAFNKMLELNFKHAQSRFQAAAYLLKKSYVRRMKKIAYENIVSFANLTQLNVGGGCIPQSSFLNSSVISQPATKRSPSPILMQSYNSNIRKEALYMSDKSQFNNIVGPFQRSQLDTSNLRSSLQYTSGHATPVIANINVKQTHLQKLQTEMGVGAVPKGFSRREGSGSGSRPTTGGSRKSNSKSTGRIVPKIERIFIQ